MNGWDIFTWISAIALGASAVVIFALFLRDARGVLERDLHRDGEPRRRED